jgi:iron complex transport system permease protein
MGSFSSTTFHKVFIAAIPVCSGLVVLFLMRWKLNMLSMGDEEAYTLGINPHINRLIIIITSTIITAACVAVTGVIGWVGMILPNICREYINADNKVLLPASCIAGATFMVLVDLLARSATAAEIPIGILTALAGTPVFALMYRKGKGDLN